MPRPTRRSSFAALLVASLAAALLIAAPRPAHAAPAPKPAAPAPTVIVAEAEDFTPVDPGSANAWKPTFQDDSYASHTYGGMWASHGGLLGAPAAAVGPVATKTINVPVAGRYRVWSKYQAPPYYNYLHQLDVIQNGKTVFTHVYGKVDAPRLWSFGAEGRQLWWFWGVDHDAAEAPAGGVQLSAGPAELRLTAVANAQPAGDRFVDFIVLTTNLTDKYQPGVASPFMLEAKAASNVYARFQNTSGRPAKMELIRRVGHVQPNYGGDRASFPAAPVPAGQWSPWFNIGPFCCMVIDDGLQVQVPGASTVPFQVARDPNGMDRAGDLKVASGDDVVIPMDITWNKHAQVLTSSAYEKELIADAHTHWRTANAARKPQEIAYFGAFGRGTGAAALKDALGYNTMTQGAHLPVDRIVYGSPTRAGIQAEAARMRNRAEVKVLSLGDEISLGEINWHDPAEATRFHLWFAQHKITAKELGTAPGNATPSKTGDPHLVWYSSLFNEDERFAVYRAATQAAHQYINPHVEVGANYSPHHLAMYYGPVFQWVDIFKQGGMDLFWAEDYVFSVPEVPSIYSWELAEARCGAKYHHTPIQSYVMPHAPGQIPSFLRRNMVLAAGTGVQNIDNFWIAPAEDFTENSVAWRYPESFRTIHESIYDSGEVEKYTMNGTLRPGRVAVVLSKATDFNETRTLIAKAKDPFLARCDNSQALTEQTLCRKDQQMLYLALREAGQAVELITEDDIAEDGILKNFDAVYFAGEWIDNRTIQPLTDWVKAGGVLYATAGAGHLNQFGQPEPAMLQLLGLKDDSGITKNLYVIRTLLELPLAKPIDTITFAGQAVGAVALKQVLVPDTAKVIATWSDGSAATTELDLGKGKVFTVGTLAGNTYMKTGVKAIPWARGGEHTVYNPTTWSPAATQLVRLGIDAAQVQPPVVTSNPLVEANAIDQGGGTVVSLVNWTNAPIHELHVSLNLGWKPRTARSVQDQKSIAFTAANGKVSFTTNLEYGNYIVLEK